MQSGLKENVCTYATNVLKILLMLSNITYKINLCAYMNNEF